MKEREREKERHRYKQLNRHTDMTRSAGTLKNSTALFQTGIRAIQTNKYSSYLLVESVVKLNKHLKRVSRYLKFSE